MDAFVQQREVISHHQRRNRLRVDNVIGVFGEILVTAALLTMLFLGWKLWFNDVVVLDQLTAKATVMTHVWDDLNAGADIVADPQPVSPPLFLAPPTAGSTLGVIRIPRFGKNFAVPILEGIGSYVLTQGVGHYPSTQMPGAVGNFAVAGHRTTYGAPFRASEDLREGDSIYVEVKQGWYRYTIISQEVVAPEDVGVLEPYPNHRGEVATERFITLTTCHPIFSAKQRLITLGVLEGWYPREGGTPVELRG
jgi:sortase A